jgi:hypothetical protein
MAVVALGALVFAGSAQACSCVPMAHREAMRVADAAIAGRLLKVTPQGEGRAIYRYRVQRVYKGDAGIARGRTLAVHSSQGSAACGLPTELGRRYGLLLARTELGWSSGACALLGKPRCTG